LAPGDDCGVSAGRLTPLVGNADRAGDALVAHRADDSGMPIEIGTREELMAGLELAVMDGQPTRLLVVFRLGGYEEFVRNYGSNATDALMTHVASRLPEASGPSHFYYRPRKNELCAIIGGHVQGVEGALASAARDVHEGLEASGITLGFGTVVVPHEAHDAIGALALADGRLTGVIDGEPMPRDSHRATEVPQRTGVLKPAA
jgi:GGDEF domain-containing protein